MIRNDQFVQSWFYGHATSEPANMSADGRLLISYGTGVAVRGSNYVIITEDTFSQTTSQQLGLIPYHRSRVFYTDAFEYGRTDIIPDLKDCMRFSHGLLVKALVELKTYTRRPSINLRLDIIARQLNVTDALVQEGVKPRKARKTKVPAKVRAVCAANVLTGVRVEASQFVLEHTYE